LARLNVRKARIDKTLLLLSLESPAPIAKQETKWVLTTTPLTKSFWERTERLTELRRAEQRQMQEYVDLKANHMEFLIRALDGKPTGIHAPVLAPLSTAVDLALVREAVGFLRRSSLALEPRTRWPAGGLPHFGLNGPIPAEHQAQPGKILCIWGDAGWGEVVRRSKYQDQYFADELVAASAALVQKWQPQPAPAWVSCIPSRRHPELVPDFARRLAAALNLRFYEALEKSGDRPEQKTMQNSIQQARNVDGSLAVKKGLLPEGALILVDDLVDSRWTMAIAAWLLRSHGSGPVFPLALALAAHDQ
jgi:ATP-dependent DNA helicase RecQ